MNSRTKFFKSQYFRYVAETESSKTEAGVFGHVMLVIGLEEGMMLARGEARRKRGPPKEELDGGNTRDNNNNNLRVSNNYYQGVKPHPDLQCVP